MTNLITLTIPNDDHVALRAFGKALEEMALAHGAESHKTTIGEIQQDDYKQWYDEALEASNEAGYSSMSVADVIRNMHGYMKTLEQYGSLMHSKAEVDTTAQQAESLAVDLYLNGRKMDGEPAEDTGFDSTGTPWDERIHSTSKALNTDGTWRLRRKPKDMDDMEWSDYVTMIKADLQYPVECGGEEPTLEEAVDASIEAAHAGIAQEFGTGIANAAFTGDRNEPAVTPPGDDFHTDVGVVTEQTVASIPPIPVPPPVTSAMAAFPPYAPIPNNVPASDVWDFPGLMKFLTERHGRITVEQVNALLAVDGLAALTDLNAHPDKIGPFVARVKAHLGE